MSKPYRVFVATLPTKDLKDSPLLSLVKEAAQTSQGALEVVHNYMTLAAKKSYEEMMRQDSLMLQSAHYVLYDLDSNPGEHFIFLAAYLGKPIMGVSSTLTHGVPPYFASAFLSIMKPNTAITICLGNAKEAQEKQAEVAAPQA